MLNCHGDIVWSHPCKRIFVDIRGFRSDRLDGPFLPVCRYMTHHRHVVECVIGRLLCSSEVVDHIDHNMLNSSPLNLRVTSHRCNMQNRTTMTRRCDKSRFTILRDGKELMRVSGKKLALLGLSGADTSPFVVVDNACSDLEGEVWKVHPKGIRVSNKGRVQNGSRPPHRGAPKDIRPYLRVRVGRKVIPVHRLVAEMFCERSSPDQVEVDHIDGNPGNNDSSNLRWVTRRANKQASGRGVQAFSFWSRVKLALI